MSDPLAAADLRGWAWRLLGVLRRTGRPLLVLQAACLLPAGLAAAGLARLGWLGGLAGGLLGAAATALAQAGSIHLVVAEAAGRPTAVTPALAVGRRSALPLLGWSALAALLTAIGLALAVLPGLYVATLAAAALPGAVVVERAGLRRAAALVNHRLAGTAARCAGRPLRRRLLRSRGRHRGRRVAGPGRRRGPGAGRAAVHRRRSGVRHGHVRRSRRLPTGPERPGRRAGGLTLGSMPGRCSRDCLGRG